MTQQTDPRPTGSRPDEQERLLEVQRHFTLWGRIEALVIIVVVTVLLVGGALLIRSLVR